MKVPEAQGQGQGIMQEGRRQVVIEDIKPEVDCGCFPIKRVAGEKVVVTADIFADGYDAISARILYKKENDQTWREAPMRLLENDRWKGEFAVEEVGIYHYTVEGWINHFKTWQEDLRKKFEAGQSSKADILIGIGYLEATAQRATQGDLEKLAGFAEILRKKENMEEVIPLALSEELASLMEKYPDTDCGVACGKDLSAVVDRGKALFSAWYEFFPRSTSAEPGTHGTFKDCQRLLPEISKMGFDVLYLPPIHPIGMTNRKGKNNALEVSPDDVGSPWAIGSTAGGHKAIHPQLGTLEDFEGLVKRAKDYGMEIAMDLAFQCSPDHPYIKEYPEWFKWRPDGTLQCAENPPKKYEDIIPLNFESKDWKALWEELRSVAVFWIEKGIRIFRVDNPHTKPFAFWQWLIRGLKKDYPDVIFLAEAFTRPKVMYRLAKIGFTQSYTYFAWRNTKKELIEYLIELTQKDVREYFRPNFWPNTPDILPEALQYGGKSAFATRLILAATLSSNYGVYGPAFELCVNESFPGKEEYLNAEKYEIKHWEWEKPGNLRDLISRINRIRKENPALQTTWNLRFYEADNDSLLFYGKSTEDLSNIILVVVNLDPFHIQSGWVNVPLRELEIDPRQPYLVHDLLSDNKYIWQGERNYVELNPRMMPAGIFRLRKRLRREMDFDYFV